MVTLNEVISHYNIKNCTLVESLFTGHFDYNSLRVVKQRTSLRICFTMTCLCLYNISDCLYNHVIWLIAWCSISCQRVYRWIGMDTSKCYWVINDFIRMYKWFVCLLNLQNRFWLQGIVLGSGMVLEISLSSFQAACLSRTRTVRSSRKVSSDTATQFFAKVSSFPSWRPKKRSSLHFLICESKQGQLTPLFSLLCMPREML